MKLQELKAELKRIREAQEKLDISQTSLHCDKKYSEFLDEVYGPTHIGYLHFSASKILKELDPIAYRVGFSDYLDGLDIQDCEEWQELEEQAKQIERKIETQEQGQI